jgi:hypothetical protein
LRQPRAFAWIDAKGAIEVAIPDDPWNGKLPVTRRTPVRDDVQQTIFLVASGIDLDKLPKDDPPPPEDSLPDDDDSGGTGTAMALEEGKMGNPLRPGEHRFPRPTGDHRIARNAPTPVADVSDPVVVVAVPDAPAIAIARVFDETRTGAIAVASHDQLAVLATGYTIARDTSYVTPEEPWIELHVAPDGIHLIGGNHTEQVVLAWKGANVDRDAFRDAYTKLAGGAVPQVDVLAGTATAQQLVDTLIALEGLGVKAALGQLRTSSDDRLAALRRPPPPATAAAPTPRLGSPTVRGDLDQAIIRRYIRRNLPKITYCYEKELLAKRPNLGGTLQTQFQIGGDGKVKEATAKGVDPDVASCVAGVIKTIEFPAPKGGGSVQVSYPFELRPAP